MNYSSVENKNSSMSVFGGGNKNTKKRPQTAQIKKDRTTDNKDLDIDQSKDIVSSKVINKDMKIT